MQVHSAVGCLINSTYFFSAFCYNFIHLCCEIQNLAWLFISSPSKKKLTVILRSKPLFTMHIAGIYQFYVRSQRSKPTGQKTVKLHLCAQWWMYVFLLFPSVCFVYQMWGVILLWESDKIECNGITKICQISQKLYWKSKFFSQFCFEIPTFFH